MKDAFSIQIDKLVLSGTKKIAVAISGGADSFALLHLVQQQGLKIIALTVDHQLRKESADEAKQVAAWCKENDIEHHILNWQGDKPVTALQTKARNARRRLLCDYCKQHNIEFLLLGHQADDQAETMLMRLQRGTGLKGMKVMQPFTRDKATNTAILRPLLGFRRSELRDYCIKNNLPFIDDPSNENPFFERVRIRQALSVLPELATGVTITARRLRRADETLQKLAQKIFETLAQFPEPEKIWLPLTELAETLPEIRLRILEIAIQTMGKGRVSLPQLEKLSNVITGDFTGMTLANCWIQPKIQDKYKGFLFRPAPPRQSDQ